MLISNGTRPYYRGVWNGQTVSGGMYLSNSSSTVVQTAIDLQDELYFMFTVSDGSPFTFFMLEHTGKLTSLSWNNQSFSWVTIVSHPAAACDIYSSCGPFGYCDLTVRAAMCQCLDGFEPNGLNISGGCRRKETLIVRKAILFHALVYDKGP
ncbi:S-locus-specific glycoprotein [Hordeum vulgare]|nr:S-locus-specific glycoprotein [Hordeum vulgare]